MSHYEQSQHEIYSLLSKIKLHKLYITELYSYYKLKKALKHYDYEKAVEIANKLLGVK